MAKVRAATQPSPSVSSPNPRVICFASEPDIGTPSQDQGLQRVQLTPQAMLPQPLRPSSSGSPAAPTPAAPHTPDDVLFSYGQAGKPTDQVVVDHQGPSKLVVQRDGAIVWEAPDGTATATAAGARALFPTAARVLAAGVGWSVALTLAFGGWLGASCARSEVRNARIMEQRLTSRRLTRIVSENVSASVAGILSGLMMGPLLAVRSVAGKAARPLLLVGVAHRAVVLLRGGADSARRLLGLLQDGSMQQQFEALYQMELQAGRSGRFRSALLRAGGVETLLRMLQATQDSAYLHLTLGALTQLMRDSACKEALVAADGLALVTPLLQHPTPAVVKGAVSTLAKLADHPLAQEHFRSLGGIPMLVSLLHHTLVAAWQKLVVEVIMHLSVNPVLRPDLFAAGAIPALLPLLEQPLPHTQMKDHAVASLHNLAVGSPEGLAALQALPGSHRTVAHLLSAWGPGESPSKAQVHALLVAVGEPRRAPTPAALGGEAFDWTAV